MNSILLDIVKTFFLNVLQGLTVSAITVTAILLWNFNTRLTRIEGRLETITPASHASTVNKYTWPKEFFADAPRPTQPTGPRPVDQKPLP